MRQLGGICGVVAGALRWRVRPSGPASSFPDPPGAVRSELCKPVARSIYSSIVADSGAAADTAATAHEDPLPRAADRPSSVAPAVSEGLWEWDAATGEVTWSDRTLSILGYDRRTFGGTIDFVQRITHPDDRVALAGALSNDLDDFSSHEFDVRLQRADGTYGIFRARAMALRDGARGGMPTRWVGSLTDVTERRMAEDAIRDSEQRFRGYFELSVVGLAISRPNKGIVEVNDHFCNLLGYSREELLKKTWIELTYPDDLRADLLQFERVLAGEIDTYNVDKRYIKKSGEWLHAEIAVRCVRRKDGTVDYFLGLVHDVSARVRALAALRESESRFRLLVENSRDLIMEVDTDGCFVYASPHFATLLGVDPEKLLHTNLLERVHPEDHDRLRALLQRPAASFSFRGRHAKGAYLWLEANASRFSTSGGEEHCVLTCRDVTERIGMEQALRESEEKFSKAFQVSPHAMAIADLETREFIEVNEGFERATSSLRDGVVGRKLGDLGRYPPEEIDRLLEELAKQGSLRGFESEVMDADGHPAWSLISAETMEFRGRKHVIFSHYDITEQKRVERAKAGLEEQLRHVQKMEAIGTLAGGIAHDFNNILGVMLAYTDLARLDTGDNPAVIDSLREVQRAGGRAKDLVRQILTFSRRGQHVRKPTRLGPLVTEATKLLRSTLPATIRLVTDVSSDTSTVLADPTQIHQILLNLATNAAHSMKGGAGELVVRVFPRVIRRGAADRLPGARSGRYVQLSVSDTGHGMDAATLERIFEPFFTTKKPGEGTGLGLSVVHGIVRDHGGTIHVESEKGRGTTVHVLLPVHKATAEGARAAAEPVPRGNGERILFIDDEPMLCAGAKKLLERLNYDVTTETSAIAAVHRFKTDARGFDLVLTDLNMPVMSGVDVATELLKVKPGTPVVLATGFNADLTMEAVRAIGIRELVVKPLSAAELAQRVHAALQQR